MQPGSETILVTVDIQSNNQRLTDLRKELILNKQAIDELNKGFKDGRVSIDTLAEGQQKASVTAKAITGEIALLTKANAQQTVANKAATGSTEQLRAQYGLAVAALNKLTAEERENTAAGQKLEATSKAMSDELKRQEAAYGSTSRSVGDYNKGIKDVNVVSGQLTGGLQTAISQGLSPFRDKIDQGTGLLGKFRAGSDLVTQGLSLLKGGGETGALGLKAIASGIALTGIGLFVVALTAVVTYFTQTAEGAKVLAGVLGGLGAILQVATDAVTGIGKALVEAATRPKQAFKDLGEFVENNIINRFKAFGVILDAVNNRDFKGVANGILQLGTGVKDVVDKGNQLIKVIGDAGSAGKALADEQKAILKARQELAPEEAKEIAQVAVLLRLTKEKGKTAAEQLDALKEAGKIENESSLKKVNLIQREIAATQEGIRIKGAGRAADLKAELSAQKTELETAIGNRNETNARVQVRQSIFVQEQRKAAIAAALQARQDEVINRQTLLDTSLSAIVKGSAAELAVKKKLLEAARDLELAADGLTEAKKANIRQKSLDAIQALEEEFNKKVAESAKKEQKREYDENLALLEDYLGKQQIKLEQSLLAGEINEKTLQNRAILATKAGLAAKLVLAKEYGQSVTAIQKEITKIELADLKIRTAAEQAENEKRVQTALQFGSEIGALFAQTLSDTGASLEEFAARTLVILLDSLEKSVLAAQAKVIFENAPLGALGLVQAAAETALITAAFEGVKAVLTQTTAKKFASGGYVAGAGTGTSDSIPAMLSNGESVMNANTTANFTPLLSYLNQLGGGVAFSGPVSSAGRLNDGGMSARQAGAGLFPTAAEIGAAVAANVPTSIGVREINVAQSRAARVRQLTKLG